MVGCVWVSYVGIGCEGLCEVFKVWIVRGCVRIVRGSVWFEKFVCVGCEGLCGDFQGI